MTWISLMKSLAQIATKIKGLKNVSDVLIPQNLRYPGLELSIDRERASLIGLSPKEVVDNVITALTSNGMIAPSYWIDPKTGNNYMLTVQYSDNKIGNMSMDDFKQIPFARRKSDELHAIEFRRKHQRKSIPQLRWTITRSAA